MMETGIEVWGDRRLRKLISSGRFVSQPDQQQYFLLFSLVFLSLSPALSQLHTLVSLLAPHSSLPLNNGGTIILDPSHRFILEVHTLYKEGARNASSSSPRTYEVISYSQALCWSCVATGKHYNMLNGTQNSAFNISSGLLTYFGSPVHLIS